MRTKEEFIALGISINNVADDQTGWLDHDEMHAAGDVCKILAEHPEHLTPYIERWLEGLTRR